MEIGLIIFVLVAISISAASFASGKKAGKKRTMREIGKRLYLMGDSITKEKLVSLLEKIKEEKI